MNDLPRIESEVQTPALFSIDEFQRIVDSRALEGMGRLELVEGVIVRMSPAQSQHMRYTRKIFRALDQIFGDGLDGRIAQFELTLQLGPATLRDADVGIIQAFETDEKYPDPATVSLLVEVAVSSIGYDLKEKRLDYASAGIPHYWVIDVEGRRIHAMSTPLDGDYADRRLHLFGEALPVPGTDRTIVID